MSFVIIIQLLFNGFLTSRAEGLWTEWVSESETCSTPCGSGILSTIYRRGCSSPGSEDCQGNDTKTVTSACVYRNCAVPGRWGVWFNLRHTLCASTCVTARFNMRQCNPPPHNGGRYCTGYERYIEFRNCSDDYCDPATPTRMEYGSWSNWTITNNKTCQANCSRFLVYRRECRPNIDKCPGFYRKFRIESCTGGLCNIADGGWSSWTRDEKTCSVTCGPSTRVVVKTRECNNPTPSNGRDCEGSRINFATESCETVACPIDGGWSSWIQIEGQCSVTCGLGNKNMERVKKCNNPAPQNGGKPCPPTRGTYVGWNIQCREGPCPIDGGWTSWEVGHSVCSVSCGNGIQQTVYERQCTNPEPQHGGNDCPGESTKATNVSSSCWKGHCPATWTSWQAGFNGECVHACQRDVYDIRNCSGENQYCYGFFVKSHVGQCKEDACEMVHGGWGYWEIISSNHCSVTCGYGYRYVDIRRQCNDPAPVGQGLKCQGIKTRGYRRACFVNVSCEHGNGSLDGRWSPWRQTDLIPCGATCGTGTHAVPYARTCTRPAPINGGRNCQGISNKTVMQKCFQRECIVNGGWNSWFVHTITKCDVNNCQQKVFYQRVCTKPAPSPSGSPCQGDSQRVGYRDCCERNPCNRAHWTTWSADFSSVCAYECERYVYNSRQCVGDKRYCYGVFIKSRYERCKQDSCEMVPGGWSRWELISQSACTVTCGYGYRNIYLRRECNDPVPVGQGLTCQGIPEQRFKQRCFKNTQCAYGYGSLDGEWSPWRQTDLIPCSVICGIGTHAIPYARRCTNPQPTNGGRNCTGPSNKTVIQKCFRTECIVSGQWNEWFVHTVKKCDLNNCQQEVIHKRLCTNPAPSPSGAPCAGESQRVSYRDCCERNPMNSAQWTSWSTPFNGECEHACGRYVYKSRQCNGSNSVCYGYFVRSRWEPCLEESCEMVNGEWGRWELISQSACTVTCGYGYRNIHLRRECNDPVPVGQGLTCQGMDEQTYKELCFRNIQCGYGYGSLDGQWSPWYQTDIIVCDATCGIGNHVIPYGRSCDQPRPTNGGRSCSGPTTKTVIQKCFRKECIVNGGWNAWFFESVTQCNSTSCKQAVTHKRLCTNPAPSPSGSPCPGENQVTVSYRDCCERIDGGWSSWLYEGRGSCSATCASNSLVTVKQIRECNKPLPRYGGRNCTGNSTRFLMEPCQVLQPAVDGGWSSWTRSEGSCSVTCGSGIRQITQTRQCNNPAPENGGEDCEGLNTETTTEACQMDICASPEPSAGKVMSPESESGSTGIAVVTVLLFIAFCLAVIVYFRALQRMDRGSPLVKKKPETASEVNYALS